jgi:hypothetical protein
MSAHEQIIDLRGRMERSIIGQSQVIERLLLTLLCNGNVLVEGLPGLPDSGCSWIDTATTKLEGPPPVKGEVVRGFPGSTRLSCGV